ncbi:uncharacterized protein si:ch211-168f7.5 [Megalops cyprinoides]|uniref:uncharacterized protein si:ch211-168f7.5 n=1 Tax=Megalops cyprinoides TaxID=118141 RepID=UPI001863F0A7|nr:uncharacterized protein si:ch211-168f7.5 [Megalops cyprinoides]
MAGRRGCMNSLWSGSERVRIGERLKASLAGIVELELLRFRHWEMVETVLGRRETADTSITQQRESSGWISADGAARSRRQQILSPSKSALPCLKGLGDGLESRWSTLSWDILSDPLSPPTPELSVAPQLDCDSRPSSGFYSVSGSSLSDSCCSVCSEGAQGTAGGPAGVRGTWGPWDCRPRSADHSISQWQEGRQLPSQNTVTEKGERRPVSTGDLEVNGLLFLSGLCPGQNESQQGSSYPLPDDSLYSSLQLDPKFCSNLVSRKTKEVYAYPSPLHAVALQSPLFTLSQDPPPPLSNLPSSSEVIQDDEPQTDAPKTQEPTLTRPPASSRPSQLDQYISKLVLQYHSRSTTDSSSRQGSWKWSSGAVHGSSQSLTSFDSHSTSSTLTASSVTHRQSLFGNSGGVSMSGMGKRGGNCRNSINLGNLPSLNGENLNLSFHLNLKLNLSPNLNTNTSLNSSNSKEAMGSCDYQDNDPLTPTPRPPTSSTSLSMSSAWRGRKRISTCPVNHRGSLEIKGTRFSPQGFSHSLDWSSVSQEEAAETLAKVCEGSPKVNEDSAKICEISRVSGLPRSVVVGLLEEGVELDEDCFQTEEERGGATSEGALVPSPSSHSHSHPPESDRSASHSNVSLQASSVHCPQSELDSHLPLFSPPVLSEGQTTHKIHSCGPTYTRQGTPTTHFDCHPSALAHPIPHTLFHLQTQPPPNSLTDSHCSKPSPESTTHSVSPLHSHSPFKLAALSVFHRNSPFQSSLPRFHVHRSPLEGDWRLRGGSLRQEPGAGWGSGGCGWQRAEGERLYQGKHASRELVRASTVSSFAEKENCSRWEDHREGSFKDAPKRGPSFCKRLEGLFGGKEKDRASGSEKDGGKWSSQPEKSSGKVRKGRMEDEGEKANPSKQKGKGWGSHRPGVLFRSESQGVLDHRSTKQDARERRQQWVSSLEITRAGLGHSSHVLSLDEAQAFGGGGEDERLSSTASLFHLSRSQSPEGSCLSLSPLSSPSLSPPPPPTHIHRTRSFRDLGKRVFSSVKPFTFKTQSLRK